MKRLVPIILLLCHIIVAQDDDFPIIWGGLDWSADGQYIAVGTTEGVHIHDSKDLSLIKVLNKTFDPHAVAWGNNDLKLVYGDWQEDFIVIWDFETNEKVILRALDAELAITSIRWSPDNSMIIAGNSAEDNIYIWDIETQSVIDTIPIEDYTRVYGHVRIDLSPDGQYIVTGTGQAEITIWDIVTGKLQYIWEYPYCIDTLKWNFTGTQVAGGCNENVHIWDVSTGEIIRMLTLDQLNFVGLSWSPDGSTLAFIRDDWRGNVYDGVIIWDVITDDIVELSGIVFQETIHTDNVIQWSPDGSKLASISDDGKIVIWDTTTYEVTATYDNYHSIVTIIDASPQ